MIIIKQMNNKINSPKINNRNKINNKVVQTNNN